MDPSGVSSSTDVEMPTNGVPKQAVKRRSNFTKDGEPLRKKATPSIQLDAGFKWNLQALSKAAESVERGGKSPVSALNELGVRVTYSVLRQRGPAHCPSFTVAVAVADMSFEGWGHSKREARAAAARTCLNALLARAGRVLPTSGPAPDFTSDEPSRYAVTEFQCTDTKIQPPDSNKPSPPSGLFGPSISPASKSPINTLYENYPGLTFICTFGDGSPLDALQAAPPQLNHSMRFKVIVQIKDQKFEGYGSSKKLAKLAAARAALGSLCSPSQPTLWTSGVDSLPQHLADHIAKLVNEKFNNLMKEDVVHSKRKVLAGIVMTIDNKIEGAKVIAVTTGTKCVSGEHMSVRGRAVNDSHAEVAARRCLQRYLYAQLAMYAQAQDPTISIPESDLEPAFGGGYQLKPLRAIHLYVSTAPCGDGRIFSPHDHPHAEPDKHPNRLARGQLRTKIESGEGTIPVKNCTNVVQTWDGVLQGERLLTMSCSDKVARWCCVGLQGALLGRLLRPVYLNSLVLGSLLHHHHMYRAICGRIESYISSLPPPYRLQRPLLARAASTEARTPARAPSFSVCWTATSPFPEIINATTGKLEVGHPSLLCKQSMFGRWQYVVRRLPLLPQESNMEPLPKDLDHLLYNDAKMLCTPYQIAKERLTTAFETAQLGRWIKKPIEQDQFVCELLDAAPAVLFAWADVARNCNTVQICANNGNTKTDDSNKGRLDNDVLEETKSDVNFNDGKIIDRNENILNLNVNNDCVENDDLAAIIKTDNDKVFVNCASNDNLDIKTIDRVDFNAHDCVENDDLAEITKTDLDFNDVVKVNGLNENIDTFDLYEDTKIVDFNCDCVENDDEEIRRDDDLNGRTKSVVEKNKDNAIKSNILKVTIKLYRNNINVVDGTNSLDIRKRCNLLNEIEHATRVNIFNNFDNTNPDIDIASFRSGITKVDVDGASELNKKIVITDKKGRHIDDG